MYEYKTSIEVSFSHWRKEVNVTLICEIWGGEVEVVNMTYDDSREQNSDYMIGLLKEIWDNFDFEHLNDAILKAALDERDAVDLERRLEAREYWGAA